MAMTPTSALFEPVRIGTVDLSSRIAMASLTRFRTDEDHTPLPFVKDYYAQRASTPGSLILSEAVIISRLAGSITNMPEFCSDTQVAAWKDVVDAIHAKGSYVFLQLCASGLAALPMGKVNNGFDLIAPSAIPIGIDLDKRGILSTIKDPALPRAMKEDEIWQVIHDFARAAKTAIEKAGFDGVEIHAANGWLIDQFISYNSNQREDAWGGSIENRSRFAIEVTKAVIAEVGKDKVGIRLSPWSSFFSKRMADPVPQFTHVIKELSSLGIAYLNLIESRVSGDGSVETEESESNLPFLEAWGKERPVIVAGGYTAKNAVEAVGPGGIYDGRKVVIAFGRHFVSNPDLVFRVKNGIGFTPYDRKTFYNVGSEKGYVDYTFSKEFMALPCS
jgi:NADPH2 dehydrogenase